ncbi:MAG: hypothetical protein HFK03_06815 [Clostridia bacterium]|nr:hypothetical protein [Clostridia bacterium]
MVKKRLFAMLAAAPFIVSLFGAFTACKKPPKGGDTAVPNYQLIDNRAHIGWDKVAGCDGYLIEKSPTRFGKYAEVDFVTKTEYVSDDIYAYFRIGAVGADGVVKQYLGPFSYDLEAFGQNTYIISPDDDMQAVQKAFDDFYHTVDGTVENDAQGNGRARGEFSDGRFSAYFKAGVYPLDLNIGYYMSVAGLGVSPDDVTVSKITAEAPISLCNFWRTAENLSVGGNMTWAVSQATSLRRIHVEGNLSLSAGRSTSGGFLADTRVDGAVVSGSQQQWFSRNSSFGSWSGKVWNMAFVGVEGNIPQSYWDKSGGYTNIASDRPLREKPFLTFDDKLGYRVFVPAQQTGGKGVSWSGAALDAEGKARGEFIPLNDFYVAKSGRDTSATINAQLAKGKHIFLTAGIYTLDAPLEITHANTVVIGSGLATLKPSDKNTDTLVRVRNADGVKISGLLLDAGASTRTLLEVGEENWNSATPQNVATLSDLFFRVGGAEEGKTFTEACVIINSDNVVGDNFWVWRADHWDGVGWTENVAKNGVIINGDNATFYGLFVEHFLEYQTIWNGNDGVTYFYQSELPYDVPAQEEWLSHSGAVNGYASYKVADGVASHRAYALGVYSYLRDAPVRLENAIECPTAGNMEFYHLITVYLSGDALSGINHIINGEGAEVRKGATTSGLEKYSTKNNAY